MFDIQQINLSNTLQFFKELDPLQLSAKSHALRALHAKWPMIYP
jgi:hypothetical protein